MKKIYIALVICFTCLQEAYSQPESMWQLFSDGTIARWAYSWGDEFNRTSLDQYNWINSFPWGRNYSGTCSQEYMSDGNNYEFSDGILKMIVKKEDVYARGVPYEPDDYQLQDGGPNLRTWHYTSGMVFSNKKFKYGLFEINFKLPEGRGLWPAFWLYGPEDEEFDIFEYKGETPDKIHIEMHCPVGCETYDRFILPIEFGGWVTANGKFSDGFNVMRGEWGPDACFWSLNSDEFAIWVGNLNFQANLIASIGVANEAPCPFAPGPDNSTTFPAAFEIDYIRVWTRLDCEKPPINIINYSQSDTDPTVITGKEIIFSNSTLHPHKSLSLIATDEVVLQTGAIIVGQFQAKTVSCPVPQGGMSENQTPPAMMSADSSASNLGASDESKRATTDYYSYMNEESNSVTSSKRITPLRTSENKPVLYTRIYPNPSNGRIDIEFEGDINRDIKIEVFNPAGQLVFMADKINKNNLHIDISQFPAGLYNLVGTFNGKTVSEKIILK